MDIIISSIIAGTKAASIGIIASLLGFNYPKPNFFIFIICMYVLVYIPNNIKKEIKNVRWFR